MACPLHPHSIPSLLSYKQEDEILRRRGQRQPFFGVLARKAFQMRTEVTEVGVAAIQQVRLVSMMEGSLRDSLRKTEARQPVRSFLRDAFERVGKPFARRTFEQHAGKQDIVDRWFAEVQRWLQSDVAGAEIRRITETVRQDIVSLIAQGREEGLGSEAIAQRMEEEMESINRQRARVIARTETVTASNQASQFGAQQTGRPMTKTWTDAGDDRVREAHALADGQTKDLDTPYDLPGVEGVPAAKAMFPGDPTLPAGQRIQCRCVELYNQKDNPIERLLG